MKHKFFILFLITGFFLAGCSFPSKTVTETRESATAYATLTITAMVLPSHAPNSTLSLTAHLGDEFVLILESYKYAGNEWVEDYDANALSLVEHTYKPYYTYTPGQSVAIGGGGKEEYLFRALKLGRTLLNFERRHVTSKQMYERMVCEIDIID